MMMQPTLLMSRTVALLTRFFLCSSHPEVSLDAEVTSDSLPYQLGDVGISLRGPDLERPPLLRREEDDSPDQSAFGDGARPAARPLERHI